MLLKYIDGMSVIKCVDRVCTFDDSEGHDHPVSNVQVLVAMSSMGGTCLRERRWGDGETVMQSIGVRMEY